MGEVGTLHVVAKGNDQQWARSPFGYVLNSYVHSRASRRLSLNATTNAPFPAGTAMAILLLGVRKQWFAARHRCGSRLRTGHDADQDLRGAEQRSRGVSRTGKRKPASLASARSGVSQDGRFRLSSGARPGRDRQGPLLGRQPVHERPPRSQRDGSVNGAGCHWFGLPRRAGRGLCPRPADRSACQYIVSPRHRPLEICPGATLSVRGGKRTREAAGGMIAATFRHMARRTSRGVQENGAQAWHPWSAAPSPLISTQNAPLCAEAPYGPRKERGLHTKVTWFHPGIALTLETWQVDRA